MAEIGRNDKFKSLQKKSMMNSVFTQRFRKTKTPQLLKRFTVSNYMRSYFMIRNFSKLIN